MFALVSAPALAGSDLPRQMGMYPKSGPQLAMVSSDVHVEVRGAIVEVSVTQSFKNDTDHTAEATYIFPLPADAAVSAMAIKTGKRTIHASIESRESAHKRYEDAITNGVGAGMLEQERPDVFTQTVSAIPAHGTVDITLRYDTVASYHDGTWQLVLPMVVAPRYVAGVASGRPTTGTGNQPDTDRSPDASRVTPNHQPNGGGPTKVALHFTEAVEDVASPTHDLSNNAFTDPKTDHDAIVRWKVKSTARGWSEQDDGGGYAAVLVEAPPAKPKTGALDMVLVLDRSAVEKGDADAVARPFVKRLFGELGRGDYVAVAGSEKIAREAADAALRDVEKTWDRKAGAFDLTKVLSEVRGGPVVVMTSGLVADDAAAIAAAQKIGAPVHVIGVGPAPNRALLSAIAASTGGTVRFLAPDDDLAAVARDVVADAASAPPVLTVNWGTLNASDVVPAQLPRLGAGQARLVLARVAKAQAANGRAQGEVFAIVEQKPGPAPEGATTKLGPLGRRWARDRMDEMLAAKKSAADVAAFATKYGLVSPYTAMVAIGDEVVEQGGVKHSIAVPVSVPVGMRWQEVQQQNRVTVVKTEDKEDKNRKQPVVAQTNTNPSPPPPPANPQAPKGKSDDKKEKGKEGEARRDEHGRDAPKHEHRPSKVPVDDSRNGVIDHSEKPGVVTPTAPAPDTTGAGMSGDDADGDDAEVARAKRVQTGAAEPEYARTMAEEVMVVSGSRAGYRLAIALGGGVAANDGAHPVGSLSARYELARVQRGRSTVDAIGQLWLVGTDVQGRLLGAFDRGLGRYQLSLGAGVHLGSDSGLAFEATVRRVLMRHLAVYLSYDGALLLTGGAHGEHVGTVGLEWRW